MALIEKLSAIGSAIREKSGTTKKIPLSDMPQAILNISGGVDSGYEQGYAAGRESQYNEFWDNYTQNGSRYNWNNAFYGYGWNDNTYNPQTDFNNVKYCSCMFSQSSVTNIKVTVDLTNSTSTSSMFLSSTNLKTIPMLIVHKDLVFSNTFKGCTNLENLTIQGVIGKNGFDVQDSAKLTKVSLLSVLNALEDKTTDTSGTVWKITFGATNKAKLSADELKIASDKGWLVE